MTANTTSPKGLPLGGVAKRGWSIFDADIPYPVAVLFQSAIEHNSATMMEFCERNHVSLAPHGKTTMSPALFRRQIRDGAWAITAATTWQAKVMWEAGVHRVLIANQVVVPGEIEWLVNTQEAGLEVSCYVDSLAGVEIFDETLARVGPTHRLPVLLELGVPGGRTGVRSVADGLVVAAAAARSPNLTLVGVSGFDGILGAAGDRTAAEVVEEFLGRMIELAQAIDAEGWFDPSREVILTAGGSAYFDHVVDRLGRTSITGPVRVVIRSGCYISHDDGVLHQASPMGETPRTGHDERLQPAMEVWGVVLSRPEPTRAVVGIGKRDASTDELLPLVKKVRRRGAATVERVVPRRVVQVNDQHSYLDLEPSDPLAVGDLVGVGISHPCTTFDKWRSIPIVDDDYRVIEVSDTFF